MFSCGGGERAGRFGAAGTAALGLSAVLGGEAEPGFERAVEPRPFVFPRDHGPHAGFRSEWWYVTGNLESEEGRRFGYQLTIFRAALRADAPARAEGGLATDTVWMAHLGFTDVEQDAFVSAERFARGGAAGFAGAVASPFRVWTYDWEIVGPGDAESPFPMRLRAEASDDRGRPVALDLRLEPAAGKQRIDQGDRGLSRKGDGPGQASHYYSFTRLATQGTVRGVDGRSLQVRGSSWLDREWSTSALGDGQVGWDWFALQFDRGVDVMWYRLRRADGGEDPHSAGVVVFRRDRDAVPLAVGEVSLAVERHWRDDLGNAWPVVWRVGIVGDDMPIELAEFTVEAVIDEQLHDGSIRYWEGAVDLAAPDGRRVGRGYLEMTGYGRQAAVDEEGGR